MNVDRNGVEVLPRGECFRLLGTATIGRIGLTSAGLPTVLPVNYFLDGQQVLVVTSPGTKLEAARRGEVVAFEVDDFHALDHGGWSVVAVGATRVVEDSDELARVKRLPVTRWAPRGEWHVIAVSIDWISGRRIPSDSGRSVEWYPPRDLCAAARARGESDAAS